MSWGSSDLEKVRKMYSASSGVKPETILHVLNASREDPLSLSDLSEMFANLEHASEELTEGDNQASSVPNARAIKSQLEAGLRDERASQDAEQLLGLLKNLETDDEFLRLLTKFGRALIKERVPSSYIVVFDKTESGLANKINKHLRDGWRLHGGVSAAAFGISPVGGNGFAQAMVRLD